MQRLLLTAALLEAVTGFTLIVAPSLVARLLLGDEVVGSGIAFCRVAGFALLAFGVACWPTQPDDLRATSQLRGMLIYNLLITVYLGSVGATGFTVGVLLWPGVALHSVFTVLFVSALMPRK